MRKIKRIIGKKIGMTQWTDANGDVHPVTVIQAGPCEVLRIVGEEDQGYSAIMLGFGERKDKQVNKPLKGMFDKFSSTPKKVLKEFRFESDEENDLKPGDIVRADDFELNDQVDVRGRTKGLGFTGTIKRWNFNRGPMSHGSKSHRIPGSIGGGTTPGRVIKGKKMAGRKGNDYRTVLKLSIMNIENDLIFLKGSVPGKKNAIITIETSKRKKGE